MKTHCNGKDHYFDCTCGFGGLGHRGKGGRRLCTTVRRNAQADLCRPASCPKCNQDVFFVRHNGGSVWFDSLGKPWPKHGCFDDGPIEQVLRWRLTSGEVQDRVTFGVVEAVTKPKRPVPHSQGLWSRLDMRTNDSAVPTASDPLCGYSVEARIHFSDGGRLTRSIFLTDEAVDVTEGDIVIAHEDEEGAVLTDITGERWCAGFLRPGVEVKFDIPSNLKEECCKSCGKRGYLTNSVPVLVAFRSLGPTWEPHYCETHPQSEAIDEFVGWLRGDTSREFGIVKKICIIQPGRCAKLTIHRIGQRAFSDEFTFTTLTPLHRLLGMPVRIHHGGSDLDLELVC